MRFSFLARKLGLCEARIDAHANGSSDDAAPSCTSAGEGGKGLESENPKHSLQAPAKFDARKKASELRRAAWTWSSASQWERMSLPSGVRDPLTLVTLIREPS